MRQPTVLLAEDEPLISMAICDALEGIGVAVVPVSDDWRELAARCQQYRPDLVLLNFKTSSAAVCPQTGIPDGMVLARLIRQQITSRIGLITGARDRDLASSPDFDPELRVLHKPFTQAQLRSFVRQCVAPLR